MKTETAFEMAVSNVRFGTGATREVGMELSELGTRQALVITDPVMRTMHAAQTVFESLEASRIPFTVYDRYKLFPNAKFKGPAIIEEKESTVIVGEDASVSVDDFGFLGIDIKAK